MVERTPEYAAPSFDKHRRLPDGEAERVLELLSELHPFWRTVYGEAYGLLGLLSGRRNGPRLEAIREIYFLWPGGAHHAAAWLADEVVDGRDVYQCAHLLRRPRRRKEYAAPLRSLYADLDHAQLPAGTPTPSVVVESSPGRWQCYWPLTEPVDPLRGEELNRRLAYALQADRSGWDLTQLLRLPKTPNRKYADSPRVRLLQRSDVRHDPRRLDRELPTLDVSARVPIARSVATSAVETTLVPWGSLSGAAMRVLMGEFVKRTADGRLDRSASLVWIARILYGMGARRSAIVAALAERDVALGWRKYADRTDAADHYQRIVDLIESTAYSPRLRSSSRTRLPGTHSPNPSNATPLDPLGLRNS